VTDRTAFVTSVPTIARPDAFDAACALTEEWLTQQAAEYGLELRGARNTRLTNPTAQVWFRRDDESLAVAFSYKDDRVPAVVWHVLVGINKAGDGAEIEVEVAAEGAGGLLPPLAVPSFLPTIVEQIGLADVWALTSGAQPVAAENAGAFVDLLCNVERKLPVVAFSEPLPLALEAVARIARRVAGAAHIVLVESAASFGISDRLGRPLSVYQGAVRVYPPKLPANPHEIKLYFPATIQRYDEQQRANGAFGPIRFADVLARSTLDRRMWPASSVVPGPALSAIALEAEQSAPAAKPTAAPPSAAESDLVAEVTAQLDELRARNERLKSALDNANDSWFNAQTQLEELQKQAMTTEELAVERFTFEGLTGEDQATMKALFDAFFAVKKMAERTAAAEAAAQQLRDESDAQRREIAKLAWTIESLQQRASGADDGKIEKPMDYRDVEAVEAYLEARHGDSIRLHQNARAALREGLYEDSDHIIAMLDLLGRPHHAMKTSGGAGGAYRAFHAQKDALHLKYGPVLRDTSLGDYGEYYEVTDEQGRRLSAREIRHIRDLGTTFSPERMASIYFYWDGEREATVITAGPRKLPTPSDLT